MIESLYDYIPGDAHREDHTDAKRKLLVAYLERYVPELRVDGDANNFLERLLVNDIDDDEFNLDVHFRDQEDALRLVFDATDYRANLTHPELIRPNIVIDTPEITTCFHKELSPRERIAAAQIAMGRAITEMVDELGEGELTQQFIATVRDRYENLVKECTNAAGEKRTRFDIL